MRLTGIVGWSRRTCLFPALLSSMLVAPTLAARPAAEIPIDFPRFNVPGKDKEMSALRELFWLHYKPAGPLATLWDEWMPGPTLWPAVGNHEAMRQRWRSTLAGRTMDSEGYVATHQHRSIAHQLGWPFPFWREGGENGWGWHFSLQNVPGGWHATSVKTQEGWVTIGAKDAGIRDEAWNLELTAPLATIQPPGVNTPVLQAPFMQLRWRAKGLDTAQPFLEWTTSEAPEFSPQRRMYFAPVESDAVVYTMVPMYRHPEWRGTITGLRIAFGNLRPGGSVGIQAFFTQYDTRHNVNQPNFIKGCIHHFLWTRDLNQLRDQIGRVRLAMRYAMKEFRTEEEKVVVVPWVGHDGRPGIKRDAAGNAALQHGRGIGHNYWDIIPVGYRDAYGTMLHHDALLALAALERDIAVHPEWNVPGGPLVLDPGALEKHAAEVRAVASRMFWNPQTRRFVTGLDEDGRMHDYGYTFMNLEAIYYDMASPEQARDVLSWITGERTVEGDTSQGKDIYHYRFAPRASTRRNLDWYGWYWSGAAGIPFGAQVQDGGAVLGFSYHDLMARLKVLGPDNAWARMKEIISWFDEVQEAGGYRAYYSVPGRGSMQGAGTAGGLGLDKEFFESILVPQVVLFGFMGFQPTADGFRLNPRLPGDWPELTVDRIALHELVLTVRATPQTLEVRRQGTPVHPYKVEVPRGPWKLVYLDENGDSLKMRNVPACEPHIDLDWKTATGFRLER